MKLVLMEYLASLRERGELDVIMPDLLSELRFTVISKPAIGTRQYGVDVAAVGECNGVKKLYLLSIKSGDLRRNNWDAKGNSMRPSLNEIIDFYINSCIPNRYASLPVVIVLCIGGELHEDARDIVKGYMDVNSNENLTFELWNGDHLAELLLSGILRENTFPKNRRSNFRKCIAMLDESDVSYRHFCQLVTSITNDCKESRPARLTALRQIYLALWTMYIWARDANNIEAPYLCSEFAVLYGWSLINSQIEGKSKEASHLKQTMWRLVELHNLISDDYLETYVTPRAEILHGLVSAVPTTESLDVNLRVFDLVGRIGTRGLWLCHFFESLKEINNSKPEEAPTRSLGITAKTLVDTISHNPILYTPIKDNQAIDINIACLFLHRIGCNDIIQSWIQQITIATIFAYNTKYCQYPCVFNDYRDLVNHPKDDPDYRVNSTVSSLLVPTLAVWAAILSDSETLNLLAEFSSKQYKHSNLQLWYPGGGTEEHLYRGDATHGAVAMNMKISRSCQDMLSPIRDECAATTAFESLSAIDHSLWPLVILASRHYRIPVPPHLWPLPHLNVEDAS